MLANELKLIKGGKEQRDKYIERVDILEKVKELNTLANTEYMTTSQVAGFYEVKIGVVRRLYARNIDEFKNDGIIKKTGGEIFEKFARDNLSRAKKMKGFVLVGDEKLANTPNNLFSKRAVLRIGMLLRDSEVAKEIRTLLLNVYHDTEQGKENVIGNINKELTLEQQLIMDKASAEYEGNWNEVSVINAKLFNLKNKRIKELETENKNLITTATTIKDSRQVINVLIRNIAVNHYNGNFGVAWSDFYKKINYKLGINLKTREGKKSHIDKATQEELKEMEKVTRAWAIKLGLNLEELLELN